MSSVRDIFIPRAPDNVIVSIDFSSQELRIMASFCKDPTFMSAYQGVKDKDLHALTACGLVPLMLGMFKVDASEIQFDHPGLVDYDWFKEHQDDETSLGKFLKTMRSYGKTANFGIGFGSGPATISRQLMIPLAPAEVIVEAMGKTYPGIQKWKDAVFAKSRIEGYTTTAYGSRRHCGESLSKGSRTEIGRWERQLANFKIQGTAADLLKVALVTLHREGIMKKHNAMLLAPIYDELLCECGKSEVHGFLHDMSNAMEQEIPGLVIPMVADCSFGSSWGKQIEVGSRPTKEVVNAAIRKLEEVK